MIESVSIVTPVNINNHLSSNFTSTNSSLHTNLFVNPRSTFLNFAVFNSRSVRNKIESIIDHVVENDIGLCTVTETWLRWLDTVFQGQYLPSLSVNYVAINKDLEKLTPQLY